MAKTTREVDPDDIECEYDRAATSESHALSRSAWEALVEGSGDRPRTPTPRLSGAPNEGASALAVTAAATASVATALRAAGGLAEVRNGTTLELSLHREHVLTAVASERHFSADDEVATTMFAPLSRFWRAGDGWVRTHANFPWHRHALLRALECDDPPQAVARVIAERSAFDIETEVVE